MPKYEKLKNDDDGYEFELNIPKKSLPSNSSTSTRVISTPNKASTTINSTLKNRTRSEFENGSNNKNSHTKNSRNSLSSSPESSVLNNFKVASAASTIKYLEYKIDHNNDSLRSICLKFKVEITEIKRHNNLQSDSDFYAKKILNIPLNKYSSLFDLPEGHESPDGYVVRRTPSVSSNVSSNNGEGHSGSTPPLLRQMRSNERHTEAIKQKMEEIQEQTLQNRDSLNGLSNGVFTASATSKPNMPTLDSIDSSNARNFINNSDSNSRDSALCTNWKVLIVMLIIALLILPLIYYKVWQEEVNHETLASGIDSNGAKIEEENPEVRNVRSVRSLEERAIYFGMNGVT